MLKLRLITLDMTGTIFKFSVTPGAKYTQAARDHGLDCRQEHIERHMGEAFRKVNDKHPHFGGSSGLDSKDWWIQVVHGTFQGVLGDKYKESEITPVADSLYDFYSTAAGYSVFPDFVSFADEWKGKGVKFGGITNFDSRICSLLDQLGIMPKYLDFLVYSEEVGSSKPDSKIFQVAKEKAGVTQNKDILHIGDDYNKDYLAAKSMGWNSLLIDRSSQKKRLANDDVFCTDFEQVSNILSRKFVTH